MSAPMVRAILGGIKTQTRRPVRPMKHPYGHWLSVDDVVSEWTGGTGAVSCPFGRKGYRLWVRETWCETDNADNVPVIAYRAGGCIAIGRSSAPNAPDYLIHAYRWDDTPEPDAHGWRPSIHMPRWASRITLEITNVRVERLNEISEADAIAEGIEQTDPFFGCHCWRDYMEADAEAASFPDDPVGSYASLWESLHGPDSWEQNPWVWAIEFRRVDP